MAYLAYLQYWCRPPYALYVTYPGALVLLRMLQDAAFRARLADPLCIAYVHRQQFHEWSKGTNRLLQ